jgi:hypothetical protein
MPPWIYDPRSEAARVALAETRAFVAAGRADRDGAVCPCCDRFAKVYKRKLNTGMLKALVRLYAVCASEAARATEGFVKIGRGGAFKTAGGDYAKLHWWGLIEPLANATREDGSTRVGFWRITERGRRFVEGKLAVPAYVYEYDGTPVAPPAGAAVDEKRIFELYPEFDYAEMMGRAP